MRAFQKSDALKKREKKRFATQASRGNPSPKGPKYHPNISKNDNFHLNKHNFIMNEMT